MNFYIPKDELITHKHINFSVDLDEDGLLICSTPPNLAIPKRPENTSPNLMSDLNHLSMNQECTNEGGWDRCELRKWLNSEFLTLCSDELRSIVRPVIKLTSAGNKSKDMIKSNDYFFILSEKELFGRAIYSAPGEGHWYEYYRQEDVPYFATDMDLERVIRWLRSATYSTNNTFCNVYTDGSATSNLANCSLALLPGFCF